MALGTEGLAWHAVKMDSHVVVWWTEVADRYTFVVDQSIVAQAFTASESVHTFGAVRLAQLACSVDERCIQASSRAARLTVSTDLEDRIRVFSNRLAV